jgi:hypothetical protein
MLLLLLLLLQNVQALLGQPNLMLLLLLLHPSACSLDNGHVLVLSALELRGVVHPGVGGLVVHCYVEPVPALS